MMQAVAPAWRGILTPWAILCLAILLAVAPAVEAVRHGPVALSSEAEHRADHAELGLSQDMAGPDQPDASDHDQVGVALLASAGVEVPPPPERRLRPASHAADGTARDGPRRPPRVTVI